MNERAVASTEIRVFVPAEAWREFRAFHKDDTEQDALGNQNAEKRAVEGILRRLGAELSDADTIRLTPDGSIVAGDGE